MASEIATTTHELRFAWRQRQQEIDDFVRQLPSENMSTAFIVAQHGGGKSTTLPAHISDLIQQRDDATSRKTTIVYLVPSETESRLLTDFVNSDKFDGDNAPSKVQMASFARSLPTFVDTVEQICATGSLYLLLDLELSPSTEGEVLLGLALEWAAKTAASSPFKGNGLVVLSSYRSPRTLDAFTRVVGQPPMLIEVPRLDVNVGMEVLEEDNIAHVKRLLTPAGRLRAVLCHEEDWDYDLDVINFDPSQLQDDNSSRGVQDVLTQDRHVEVHPGFPCSFPVAGLSYVITSGMVQVPVFNRDIVQPVLQVRRIS